MDLILQPINRNRFQITEKFNTIKIIAGTSINTLFFESLITFPLKASFFSAIRGLHLNDRVT